MLDWKSDSTTLQAIVQWLLHTCCPCRTNVE
nr:MAG TPA: epoxyqueuosine reductase [Caudoviricetes sp.]